MLPYQATFMAFIHSRYPKLTPKWVNPSKSLPLPNRGFIIKTTDDYIIIKNGFRESGVIQRFFNNKTSVGWCYFNDNNPVI